MENRILHEITNRSDFKGENIGEIEETNEETLKILNHYQSMLKNISTKNNCFDKTNFLSKTEIDKENKNEHVDLNKYLESFLEFEKKKKEEIKSKKYQIIKDISTEKMKIKKIEDEIDIIDHRKDQIHLNIEEINNLGRSIKSENDSLLHAKQEIMEGKFN